MQQDRLEGGEIDIVGEGVALRALVRLEGAEQHRAFGRVAVARVGDGVRREEELEIGDEEEGEEGRRGGGKGSDEMQGRVSVDVD